MPTRLQVRFKEMTSRLLTFKRITEVFSFRPEWKLRKLSTTFLKIQWKGLSKAPMCRIFVQSPIRNAFFTSQKGPRTKPEDNTLSFRRSTLSTSTRSMKSTYSATNTFMRKSLNLNNQEEGSSHFTPNSTNSCFWRQKWPGTRSKNSCRSTTNKRKLCLSDPSAPTVSHWISAKTLLSPRNKILTSNSSDNNSDLWYFIVSVFIIVEYN